MAVILLSLRFLCFLPYPKGGRFNRQKIGNWKGSLLIFDGDTPNSFLNLSENEPGL